MITQDRLKELLHYDANTGVFTWLVTSSNRAQAGSVAGGLNAKGYGRIRVDNELHMAHRLVWLYMTGQMPRNQIDHINGTRSDNRWCNLREATNKENLENSKLYSSNRSGFRGVLFHKATGKWLAQVTHNYRLIYLGLFETPDEAAVAARKGRSRLFTHDIGRAA